MNVYDIEAKKALCFLAKVDISLPGRGLVTLVKRDAPRRQGRNADPFGTRMTHVWLSASMEEWQRAVANLCE